MRKEGEREGVELEREKEKAREKIQTSERETTKCKINQ